MDKLPPATGVARIGYSALLALSALAFGSCADTAPEIPQEELYLRGFIRQFGVPDLERSWSMAKPIKATVNLRSKTDGIARIYTDSPNTPGCQMLAAVEVASGRGTACFDADIRSNHVYVRVENRDGQVELSGFMPVSKGAVSISDSRSSRSGNCPVTKKAVELEVDRINDKCLEFLTGFLSENPDNYRLSWDALEKGDDEIARKLSQEYILSNKQKENVPNLYRLENFDYSQRCPEFSIDDIKPIIHQYTTPDGEVKPGLFAEYSDHGNEISNLQKYYHELKTLDPDVELTVKEDGPVIFDLMWRALTENAYWGYYYYDEEDAKTIRTDPWGFYNRVPKFIVLDYEGNAGNRLQGDNSLMEMRLCKNWEHHSSVYYTDPEDDSPNHTLNETWEKMDWNACRTTYNEGKKLRGCKIRSVSMKLVYFGKDGNGEATYDFPAGTRIGFIYGSSGRSEKFYLSDAILSQAIHRPSTTYSGSGQVSDEIKKSSDWFPTSAKFNFNGENYVGFEDGGLDCDLNDFMFRVHNTWPPETDITPDDLPRPDSKEWIIACEDLGSFDDYDFNDVVLKVAFVPKATEGGRNKVRITPVACGGQLNSYVYFQDHVLGEIHSLLGCPGGIPAGVGNGTPDIDHSKVRSLEFEVDDDWLLSERYETDFTVSTTWMNGEEIRGEWIKKIQDGINGEHLKAPQILLLPTEWSWPVERCGILDAYPDFIKWIGNIENYDWVDNKPYPGNIYTRID